MKFVNVDCLLIFRRSSICKSVSATESDGDKDKSTAKADKGVGPKSADAGAQTSSTLSPESTSAEDDRTTVKSVCIVVMFSWLYLISKSNILKHTIFKNSFYSFDAVLTMVGFKKYILFYNCLWLKQ